MAYDGERHAGLAKPTAAAEFLEITVSQVYGLMEQGKLSYRCIGRVRRIHWQSIHECKEAGDHIKKPGVRGLPGGDWAQNPEPTEQELSLVRATADVLRQVRETPVVPGPVVYFIQVGQDGPIKIGTTAQHLRVRLEALQTASPYGLRVLAAIPGAGPKQEAEIHDRFTHLRMRGEWFRSEPELLAYIAEHALPGRLFFVGDEPVSHVPS